MKTRLIALSILGGGLLLLALYGSWLQGDDGEDRPALSYGLSIRASLKVWPPSLSIRLTSGLKSF